MLARMRARSLALAGLVVLAALGACALPAAARPVDAPAWQRMASLPVPSQNMAAVLLPDGAVLALGGAAGPGGSRLAVRFSLAGGGWRRLPDAPVPLGTPAALVVNTRAVLVVASSFAHGLDAAPSRALVLDPVTGRWSALPPCPVPLLQPRLVRLDRTTVLAAGGAGIAFGATLDLTTNRWSPLAAPLAGLVNYALAPLPGRGALLLAGTPSGVRGADGASGRAFLLDPHRAWHELARPPLAVADAAAVALSSTRVLFAGGYPPNADPRMPAPPALLYDAAANRWSVAGPGGGARGAQLVGLAGGRAALIGGHHPDGSPSPACLLFDGARWHAIAALPGPWAGYALAGLADGSVLLIGGDRPSGAGFAPVGDTLLLPIGAPQG